MSASFQFPQPTNKTKTKVLENVLNLTHMNKIMLPQNHEKMINHCANNKIFQRIKGQKYFIGEKYISPNLYATFVECLLHLQHFTFVDYTIVVLHYIKKIYIVDYESIDKTYNKLNSKQMNPQISKRFL